eukprot:TRINITY_DN21980_c0_g1_i1.p1 TRINITY_DN21980_c0_g1~~TRINITY_DN21980_c0_g1_i1.p1  ORF type:complete len:363 (+),score=31.01 TRINITY_DN21980_c0_g1_i1:66-1154(+)
MSGMRILAGSRVLVRWLIMAVLVLCCWMYADPRRCQAETDHGQLNKDVIQQSNNTELHIIRVPTAVNVSTPVLVPVPVFRKLKTESEVSTVYQQFVADMELLNVTRLVNFQPATRNNLGNKIRSKIHKSATARWTTPLGKPCDVLVVIGGEYNSVTTPILVNTFSQRNWCTWWTVLRCNFRSSLTCREQVGYLRFLSDPQSPTSKQYAFIHGHETSWHDSRGDIYDMLEEALLCERRTGLVTHVTRHVLKGSHSATYHVPFIWNRLLHDVRPMDESLPVLNYCCGQFVVGHNLLASHSRSVYQRLLEATLSTAMYNSNFFEFTWGFLFGSLQVIDPKECTCPGHNDPNCSKVYAFWDPGDRV